MVISGESGIGKTRLSTQFAEKTERNGALILRGLIFEMEGMPPYLPFLEALGHYIHAAPLALLREQIGAYAPTLATLFPEIRQRLEHLPTAYALPPEQARFRLFEAIASFLFNVCQIQPVVFLLDDLQWTDAPSVSFVQS